MHLVTLDEQPSSTWLDTAVRATHACAEVDRDAFRCDAVVGHLSLSSQAMASATQCLQKSPSLPAGHEHV